MAFTLFHPAAQWSGENPLDQDLTPGAPSCTIQETHSSCNFSDHCTIVYKHTLGSIETPVPIDIFVVHDIAVFEFVPAFLYVPESKEPLAGLHGPFSNFEFARFFSQVKSLMASSATGTSGIPLTEYRKDCPPGWSPGLPDYPLKLFFDKLKLWYRVYEGPDEAVGPLIAGRLQGRAQKIALNLRLIRPDGQYDFGDSALVRLTVDEVRDPNNPQVILQNYIPSGVTALANALKEAFGQSDQELTTSALEAFFELRRGKLSLQEFTAEWELRYEEAQMRAGLDINDVAKTYLYFKQSGLPSKFIEDVKLQIQGDMSRFAEARHLALRLSSRSDHGTLSHDLYAEVPEYDHYDYYADPWAEWFQWDASTYYDSWETDEWSRSWDYYDDYDWYGYETQAHDEWYDASSDWQSPEKNTAETYDMSQGDPPAASESNDQQSQSQDYYQGGDGCFVCGSKWHRAAQCPVSQGSSQFGKGKGKGPGKGKKGFGGKSGKGKGKRPFLKGKGKGKGKRPFKGYYDEYYDYMSVRRQPDQGLRLGGEPHTTPKSSQEPIIRPSPPRQVGELFSWKGPSASADEEGASHDTHEHAHHEDSAKRSLAFVTNLHTSSSCYHTVKGHKRRGLLIDPGAAAGLVGSETLRDLLDVCYQGSKRSLVTWSESQATITGISGCPDKALGRVHLRLPFQGLDATYTADVIGKEGSLCPALVGNPALCAMKASLHSCWFENNDGLLVTWNTEKKEPSMHLFRCLLTDSGHYLLPLDDHAEIHEPQQHHDTKKFLRHLSTISNDQWPDHLFSFWSSATETAADPKQKWSSDEHPVATPRSTAEMLTVDSVKALNTKEKTVRFAEQSQSASKTVHEEEPVEGVFATNLSHIPMYTSDELPDHLSDDEIRRLKKDYNAMPEEFYTKTGRRVVTPSFFDQWFQEARSKKTKWHGWELCSGSGRFSLFCVLAGLTMGFPVDFRYGWDIGLPEHQRMLDQAYEEFCPDFLMCSPRCKFWSVSASRRDRQELMRDRESERPALVYMQRKMQQQNQRRKVYVLENPWSSAIWSDSVMAENQNMPGYRKAKRTDQCAFGACDEHRQPILKATGIEANCKLRSTLRRCNGHRGVPHVPLQGQHKGVNRTAMAAVYPVRFCKAIIEDMLYNLYPRGSFRPKCLDAAQRAEVMYTCERCQFGRGALPHMEHTFMPGECRYGRDPDKARRVAKKKLEPQASNPMLDFQKSAREHALAKDITIKIPEQYGLTPEEAVYLKYLFCQLVKDSIAILDEIIKKQTYVYWVTDPTLLMASRHLFRKILHVYGVQVTLHPFMKAFPEPYLSAE